MQTITTEYLPQVRTKIRYGEHAFSYVFAETCCELSEASKEAVRAIVRMFPPIVGIEGKFGVDDEGMHFRIDGSPKGAAALDTLKREGVGAVKIAHSFI